MADARPEAERESLLQSAIEENVRHSLAEMFRLSPVLTEAAEAGRFKAMGAIYDLASGVVNWLEDENLRP